MHILHFELHPKVTAWAKKNGLWVIMLERTMDKNAARYLGALAPPPKDSNNSPLRGALRSWYEILTKGPIVS